MLALTIHSFVRSFVQDAIAKGSFYNYSPVLRYGDVEEGFRLADRVVVGEVSTGAQEHFYMEPQIALAVPKEEGEMELFVSTQNPTEVQVQTPWASGTSAPKIDLCQ